MWIEEPKEELVKMSKDIEREYVDAKVRQALNERKRTPVTDFAPVGIDPKLEKKDIPHTNDIPDVILQAPKARKKTENKW